MCRTSSETTTTRTTYTSAQIHEGEIHSEETTGTTEMRHEAELHDGETHPEIPREDVLNATTMRGMADADDGTAAPPTVPPQPVRAEANAHRSKREQRADRAEAERVRQQQEEARRRAEELARQQQEADRLRREQEERERAEQAREQERRQKRRLLYDTEGFIPALKDAIEEQDKDAKVRKIEQFILIAGKIMVESDAESNREVATSMAGQTKAFDKMEYYLRMMNPSRADAMLGEVAELREDFASHEEKKVRIRIADRFLADVLKEEFMNFPELESVLKGMSEGLGEESNELAQRFAITQDLVNAMTGVDTVHECSSEGSMQYITTPEFKTRVESDVAAEMHAHPELTKEQAKDSVFARYREAKKAEAEALAVGTNVVTVATEQERTDYGSATYRRVCSAEKGAKIVRSAAGLLYMKPVGEGLVELRPTIPKEIMIDGERLPLRKDYIIFHKALMRSIVDEHGHLKVEAERVANDVASSINGSLSGLEYGKRHEIPNRMKEEGFPPAELLEEIKGEVGSQEEALKLVERMKLYIRDTVYESQDFCAGCGILPLEILSSLSDVISGKKKIDLKIEQKDSIIASLKKRGMGDQDIAEYVAAMEQLQRDSDTALADYMKLGDLDNDGEEIPLPQACSANGVFYREITALMSKEKAKPFFEYRSSMLFQDKPDTVFEFLQGKIDGMKSPEQATEKERLTAALAELRTFAAGNIAAGKEPFDSKHIGIINELVSDAVKYDYHVAAPITEVDGETVTVEMFAPEATTYAAAPFSTHSAIGMYKGGLKGMRGYYNSDKALVENSADAMRLRVNRDMKSPGT